MDVIVIDSSSEEEIEEKKVKEEKKQGQASFEKQDDILNDDESEEEDVIELYATKHIKSYSNRRYDRYYDDDLLTDSNEVKTRWNLKTLGDSTKNLSVLNHRARLFKDDRTYEPRRFKAGIFLENEATTEEDRIDSKSSPESHENLNTVSVNEKFENEIREFEAQIKEKTKRKIELLESKLKKTQYNSKRQNDEQVSRDYEERLENIKKCEENELKAFESLLMSGNFSMRNGKMERYAFMEWDQSATRKYRTNDENNGRRKIPLPETEIKNIMIEDEIYSHYYGKRSFK